MVKFWSTEKTDLYCSKQDYIDLAELDSKNEEERFTKMKMYALYGAGITGMGAINYFGKDNFEVVIDNAPEKQGNLFEQIPVISFDEYKKRYKDLFVIVSIYSHRFLEVKQELEKENIDYFLAPPVYCGYREPEAMVSDFLMQDTRKVLLFGVNPITERMANVLKEYKEIDISFIEAPNCDFGNVLNFDYSILNERDTIVITTNEAQVPVRAFFKNMKCNVYDIYESALVPKQDLIKFHNIHKGKRCFVIGNGPSLQVQDLNKLREKKEYSFGSNGIFNIYKCTDWRPSYYGLTDIIAYRTFYEDIKTTADNTYFVSDFFQYTNLPKLDNINMFNNINELILGDYFNFSDDLVKGIYSGRTVTYFLLQLAVYMGFNEIYLLGVDFTGGLGKPRVDFFTKEDKSKQSYFYLSEELKAYKSAKKYADAHNVKIYNATRGGELEVFPRVNFDSLFT